MVNYGARHEFLRELHKVVQPKTYLEIGVQSGQSLALAGPKTLAYGVDPNPMITVPLPYAMVHRTTSDEFFAVTDAEQVRRQHGGIDLAFIDGMHLVEFALRDFIGVERMARSDGRTVVVFDDVLPYSPDIAGREPLPGDWAGDVWKVDPILAEFRPDLTRILVDVDPTGVMVVLGLRPDLARAMRNAYDMLTTGGSSWFGEVPLFRESSWVTRADAVQPADALAQVYEYINGGTQ